MAGGNAATPAKAGKRRRGKQPTPKRSRAPAKAAAPKHVVAVQQRLGPAHSVLSRMLYGMCLPQEHPNLRLPIGGCPRTAVMTTTDQFAVSTPYKPADSTATDLVYSDSNLFGPDHMLVALIGQPGCLAMVNTVNKWTMGGESRINMTRFIRFLHTGGTVGDTWPIVVPAQSSTFTSHDIMTSWPAVAAINGAQVQTAPGGAFQPIARYDNRSYLFINAGHTLRITADFGTGTFHGQIQLELKRFGESADASSFYKDIIMNGRVGYVDIGVTAPGHYTLIVLRAGVSTGILASFSLRAQVGRFFADNVNTITETGWTIYPMGEVVPNLGGDPTIVSESRPSAVAMLLSNTASMTASQGSLVAARFVDTHPENITPTDLADQKEKFVGRAAEGAYTFMEICENMTVFRDNTMAGYPVYHLDTNFPIHFMDISCPVTAPNTYSVSVTATTEFRSNSQRYPSGTAYGTILDFYGALAVINRRPEWFYHNPEHMARVYNLLKEVGKGVQRYAPLAASIGGALNPANAAGYAALARAIGSLSL